MLANTNRKQHWGLTKPCMYANYILHTHPPVRFDVSTTNVMLVYWILRAVSRNWLTSFSWAGSAAVVTPQSPTNTDALNTVNVTS